MAGRRPKPTALKILEGNPGKRRLNHNEPRFGGVPTCPKHLNKVARSEWKRVSSELSGQGLLTTVDRAALGAYCASFARWVEAEENLAKPDTKLVYVTKTGYPLPNPFIAVANTALDQMRKFAVEFGLTPASRSRLNAASTTPADNFSAFNETFAINDNPAQEEDETPGGTIH